MGLFNRKKKQEKPAEESVKRNDALKEDISKAYDEIIAGGEENEKQEEESAAGGENGNFENELLKSRIKIFKDKKDQESLNEVIKLLPNKKFLVPSVSNMKEPFEKINGEVKLKQGAVFNPALLTSNENKVFLPVFTDEESMTQKSPSGVILRFSVEQCVSIVYEKKNPVSAVVINPFTENLVLNEDLLRMVFKEKEENK